MNRFILKSLIIKLEIMKIIKILLFLFVITIISLGTIGFESSHAAPQYIPGKYIVVLNENTSDPTRISNDMVSKFHIFFLIQLKDLQFMYKMKMP